MNFVIVHYNTPDLTLALISSIIKHCGWRHNKIFIFENSNSSPIITPWVLRYATILDNTQGRLVNFDKAISHFKLVHSKLNTCMDINAEETRGAKYGSLKHSLSIDYCIHNLNIDDFILLDSDVLLKQSPSTLINPQYLFCADIDRWKQWDRVAPYIAYINAKMCRSMNIHFTDGIHIIPAYALPSEKYSADTGGEFLKIACESHIPFKQCSNDPYIVHYGSASWRSRNVYEWLYEHELLYKLM